jgi:putative nucleotidyltransferase with HDIG domain
MTRDEALKLLHDNMVNNNLRRHCYAVEAVMRALARRFGEDEETWGIAGLLHDADYELTKDDNPEINHTKHALQWIKEADANQDIYDAVAAHGWGYVEGAPEPKTNMQWALYTCDELTGFIVAVTLVKPEKKLSSVSVESVLKKWKQRSFAAGVHRDQIELCESRLNISLREFIEIAIKAMQGVHEDLGL